MTKTPRCFGCDIFGAQEMWRLVNSEFIHFSSLTGTQQFRSQSRIVSTLLILNLIKKYINICDVDHEVTVFWGGVSALLHYYRNTLVTIIHPALYFKQTLYLKQITQKVNK